MYSKPRTSNSYLDLGVYCIKDDGPNIDDEVNIDSLEELREFVTFNVIKLILQSLEEETTVIITESDDANLFNSLLEAIERKLS